VDRLCFCGDFMECRNFFQRRVIDVADHRILRIESGAVVFVEGRAPGEALGQVGVGKEVVPEQNNVSMRPCMHLRAADRNCSTNSASVAMALGVENAPCSPLSAVSNRPC
jgi:hypothetical protein